MPFRRAESMWSALSSDTDPKYAIPELSGTTHQGRKKREKKRGGGGGYLNPSCEFRQILMAKLVSLNARQRREKLKTHWTETTPLFPIWKHNFHRANNLTPTSCIQQVGVKLLARWKLCFHMGKRGRLRSVSFWFLYTLPGIEGNEFSHQAVFDGTHTTDSGSPPPPTHPSKHEKKDNIRETSPQE